MNESIQADRGQVATAGREDVDSRGGSAQGVRAGLRGLSFSEQVQALTPPGSNLPVQLKQTASSNLVQQKAPSSNNQADVLPASQALTLVQPLEAALLAAGFAGNRADGMSAWLNQAFAVLEAARKNEVLTSERAKAYELAKKFTAPSSFERFLSFVGAATSIAGAVKAGLTAIKTIASSLGSLGKQVTVTKEIGGKATDIIRSPRLGDEAKRVTDAAKGGGALKGAGSAAKAGAEAAGKAIKKPAAPVDVAKGWMAANSKAITELASAQAHLNALGFDLQEIGLLEQLSGASVPVVQVAERLAAFAREGKKLDAAFSARLSGAVSALAAAFNKLKPRINQARSLGRALSAANSNAGDVEFAKKGKEAPGLRSIFDLLRTGGTLGGVAVRDALQLIEAKNKHVDLDTSYQLDQPVDDFVAGPTTEERPDTSPTARITAKHSRQAETSWHLRIVNPRARKKLAPLLLDIQAAAPKNADEIVLTPAAAAILRSLGKKVRRGKPKEQMFMPSAGGFHDSKLSFGQYKYTKLTEADELVEFVKTYPTLFKSKGDGRSVPPRARVEILS